MIKTILVPATGNQGDVAVFEAALNVAREFNGIWRFSIPASMQSIRQLPPRCPWDAIRIKWSLAAFFRDSRR
jgi:hypothetical protein